jgi:hypothetical protein
MTDSSISKKHSMDYITVDGVILRTGYSKRRDWYLVLQNKKEQKEQRKMKNKQNQNSHQDRDKGVQANESGYLRLSSYFVLVRVTRTEVKKLKSIVYMYYLGPGENHNLTVTTNNTC